MRRLLLLFALLCTALPASSQSGAEMKTLPQAELDVIKVLLAQERAWNSGDLNGFLTGYKHSGEVLFIGGDVAKGFDALSDRYHRGYPDKASMGTLTFSDLQPQLVGSDHAIVVGHYQLERGKKAGGPASGIFSLVLENTPAGWKIILDHTT